uniref:Uncharacterized protein n=1 Tax=Magallana gigas TaxID=29159 RepID=K1P9C8_MAGGI
MDRFPESTENMSQVHQIRSDSFPKTGDTLSSRQLLSAPICSPLKAPGCVPGVSYCSVTGSPLWVYVLQMIPVSRLLPKHRTDEEDSSKMCWMSKL